ALIIGAGDAGVALAREMQTSPHIRLTPVAFVDDDSLKIGRQIRGLPIVGSRQQIQTIALQTQAKVAIIAMPTASGKVVRETVEQCQAAGLETRIIPGIYELLDERVTVKRLRNVQLDDLLRRETRTSDTTFTPNYLTGQRVLITGAGGSIGSELCRQIARYRPSQIILLGHGENSIFQIHNEILSRFSTIKCEPVIADVRNLERLTDVFQQFNPDIVFHAAAHKHVLLMEMNPSEAITNNVFGTRNVLTACEETNVKQFVLVSTDKAVRPASIMGATKRLAEILVLDAAQRTGKAFVAVRFGNVLGSRGSIVPIFQNQIATGGPVTVTHPDVKRFFMTIPEATQLIIRAGALGRGGEIFVLDMGEQIKIVDLAKDLIRLSGLEVNRDIDIVFTDLRPGEKLEEELFAPDETYKTTPDERIFVIHSPATALTRPLLDGLTSLETALHNNNHETLLDSTLRVLTNLSSN
ncbi:MAG: polysaccharide biosynthesis protein, partial [Chloroflexi bacterium]|nr:polysaccharide biosynthesis protein [Chloroflexota bacterium]